MRIVLDSSAWIESFTGGPNAAAFAAAAMQAESIIVPSIVVYEVFRYSLRQFGIEIAETNWATLSQYDVLPLTGMLAAVTAEAAHLHHLAFADAAIWTTTRVHGAELWTQDAHFRGSQGVNYLAKLPSV